MNDVMVQVAAFSGLLGALLTQALSGLFAYYGDKRKSNLALKADFRNKQIEIAENFYFVNGEKIAIIEKNIGFWSNWTHDRSQDSIQFLSKEMTRLNAYMEKLDAENWKYNLVGLYFDVSLNNSSIVASNNRSKELYLKVLDIADTIEHALDESKGELYQIYDEAIKEMCDHYDQLSHALQLDMQVVKSELLNRFNN